MRVLGALSLQHRRYRADAPPPPNPPPQFPLRLCGGPRRGPRNRGVGLRTSCQTCGMPTVRVFVTLKPSLLDSAGRTVAGALQKLGFDELREARIGKMIVLDVERYDEARVRQMCDKLLANPVIE